MHAAAIDSVITMGMSNVYTGDKTYANTLLQNRDNHYSKQNVDDIPFSNDIEVMNCT